MRRAGLSLPALLAAAPVAFAQAPPAAPPPVGGPVPMNLAPVPQPPAAPVAAINPALVAHLNAWEAKHKTVANLYAKCEMVRKNTLNRTEKAHTGVIMCMKPNLAWMRIEAKGKPADWIAYICDGKSVFEYDAGAKVVNEHRVPKANPTSVGDNLLIEFMSGAMTAADVMKRFDLTLEKEEKFYVHIRVKPRLPRDLQEFESLLLVLYGPGATGFEYLPAVVVMRNPNGQTEETWTFDKPAANVKAIGATNFQFVPAPKDWQFKPAAGLPPAGSPTVARPTAPGK